MDDEDAVGPHAQVQGPVEIGQLFLPSSASLVADPLTADVASGHLAEAAPPEDSLFMADVDAAFGKTDFNLAQRQREPDDVMMTVRMAADDLSDHRYRLSDLATSPRRPTRSTAHAFGLSKPFLAAIPCFGYCSRT